MVLHDEEVVSILLNMLKQKTNWENAKISYVL